MKSHIKKQWLRDLRSGLFRLEHESTVNPYLWNEIYKGNKELDVSTPMSAIGICAFRVIGYNLIHMTLKEICTAIELDYKTGILISQENDKFSSTLESLADFIEINVKEE